MTESFHRARLEATLRACRALRHELATPLSAAALHLEVAHRAAGRAHGAVPEKTRVGVSTAIAKLEQASKLLDVLSALGDARVGEPDIVDFGALLSRAARRVTPQLDALGLEVRDPAGAESAFVAGFGDELEEAIREALLAASRWAGAGEACFQVGGSGEPASFSFRVPLGADRPGGSLFSPCSRPGAGFGPFMARWTFEAHGGRLEASENDGFVTVTGSVPQAVP